MSEDSVMLEEATKDVWMATTNELNKRGLLNDKTPQGNGFILIHRDNLMTSEKIGSINLSIPVKIDGDIQNLLQQANIPTDKSVMICHGIFDASEWELSNLALGCVIRNKHGYPLSYVNEKLLSISTDISNIIVNVAKKEIREDIADIGY